MTKINFFRVRTKEGLGEDLSYVLAFDGDAFPNTRGSRKVDCVKESPLDYKL